MLSNKIPETLRRFPTPFYLYDMDLLRETLDAAVAASSPYGYILHYALKANFDQRIIKAVREAGLGADCVSGNEVKLAVESGFPPSSIVFAGVGKKSAEIRYAIEHGILAFNCESLQELEVINEHAANANRVVDVAMRVNPDMDAMTHSYISTGKADSKFGVSEKDLRRVPQMLPNLKNINVVGLHFHIGSQIRDLSVFRRLCLKVNEICRWFSENIGVLKYLNMGGGLGIEYGCPERQPVPDFEAYFAVFHENLSAGPEVNVHFELGRSLVAQCGELISRVLYTKSLVSGRELAIIDASMAELIRPALYQARHAMENLSGAERPERDYSTAGTVCESSDMFAVDIRLPEMRRGDLVSIKSTGAYGVVMASRYNLHDLPQAVYSDDI